MSSPVTVPVRRRSIAGPIVLIVLGILFLLVNMHLIAWPRMFHLFAQYWPLLLILWGGVKLYEYYQAKNEGLPATGIGAGGVFMLIFIISLGLLATAANKAKDQINWGAVRDDVQLDDDFMHLFGNDYNYEQAVEQDFTAPADGSASIKVVCDRGSVNVNFWDEKKVKVVAHKKIFAKEQSIADQRNTQSLPQIQVNGNSVMINANTQGEGNSAVRTDLDIFIPKTGAIDVATRRGDIVVNPGHIGDIKISNHRGDVQIDDVKGTITLALEKGSVRVTKVDGSVTFDGRADDVDIGDVTGTVRLNGDFFGNLKLAGIKKTVIFQSSRTDMELGSLEGDLDLDSGDVRATKLTGPIKLITRSKDIHLEDITGDVRIENNNGSVELHAADKPTVGNIEVSNHRGDIHLVLPAKAAFQMNATTRRGEVQSDFTELNVNTTGGTSVVTGTVGKGGGKVQVNSDTGDIEIRKIT